jgi:hypothetical protein
VSTTRSSASDVHRRPSSSLMVPSWPSPSVLTLGHPCHALSRVRFIGPCPSLTPMPLTCVGSHLSRPWCRRARHNGRHPSSSPMVHLLSSSMISPCDGHASARVDHQHVSMRLGRRHVRHGQLARLSVCARTVSPSPTLSRWPRSAGCSTYVCSGSGPLHGQDPPHGRSLQ